ncbi:MAG: NUDIX hydrolase [Chloroflexi bacterium]|nr:NUDIX hydrolase [Chloroflexota bacterium]MBU1751278.1 NUDIX hydrolase [Chloroflexota bacterium]MBU1877537.1 NUDIX hydrolase [Chloroflexota bacterium]
MGEEATISTKRVYSGRTLRLRVDRVRLSSGRVTTREIVGHRGAVAIVALDDEGQVLLVQQYRKPVERALLELPAGTLEPGENPEDCAFRELQEETGYRADTLRSLTTFYTTPGYSSEHMYLYLAQDLHPVAACAEQDECIEVLHLPLDQAVEQVRRGEIRDAKSIAGLLFVADLLRQQQSDPA